MFRWLLAPKKLILVQEIFGLLMELQKLNYGLCQPPFNLWNTVDDVMEKLAYSKYTYFANLRLYMLFQRQWQHHCLCSDDLKPGDC